MLALRIWFWKIGELVFYGLFMDNLSAMAEERWEDLEIERARRVRGTRNSRR